MFSPFDISCDRPNWNWILWDKITAHIKSREWQLLFVLTSFLPSPCSYCFLTDFHVKDCRMNNVIFFFFFMKSCLWFHTMWLLFTTQLYNYIMALCTNYFINFTYEKHNSFILSWSLSVQVFLTKWELLPLWCQVK